MKLITNLTQFDNDLKDVIRLFFPLEEFNDDQIIIEHETLLSDNITNSCVIRDSSTILYKASTSCKKQTFKSKRKFGAFKNFNLRGYAIFIFI